MKLFNCLLVAFLLVGCTEESGLLLPKPPPGAKEKQTYDNVTLFYKPKVDIIFVVDDSGSMGTHQRNLSNNITLFTDNLKRLAILDYHIGVITTDMRRNTGELRGTPKFIDNNTVDAEKKLAQNIEVGTYGDATESVFHPVIQALGPPVINNQNAGFYRDDAYLALVFITDAEDQSVFSSTQFLDYLLNLKFGDIEKILGFGVIVPSGATHCSRDEGDPVKIESFISMVGGAFFGLCDQDFGKKLAELGQNLVQRIKLFVPFEVYPIPRTIKVTYGEYVVPNDPYLGWTYIPSKVGIVLGKGFEVPEEYKVNGAKLDITYQPAEFEKTK